MAEEHVTEQRLAALETDVAVVNERGQAMQKQVDNIERTVLNLSGALSTMATNMATHAAVAETVRKDVTDIKSVVSGLDKWKTKTAGWVAGAVAVGSFVATLAYKLMEN